MSLSTRPAARATCAARAAPRVAARPAAPRGRSLRCRAGLSAEHQHLEASLKAPSVPGSRSVSPSRAPPAQQQHQQPPQRRAPLPPIVSAAGRPADDVAAEVASVLEGHRQALVSSVEPELYASLRKLVPAGVQYQARAKMLTVKPHDSTAPKQQRLPGTLCVVSAGAEDLAAADQVKVAAEHMGCYVLSKHGLGLGDLPKLIDQAPALQAADVVVVVAGADSGLPSAVAGLVDAPVVALPTSRAGAAGALQGLQSLMAAVGSAAPGVVVVNVDAAVSAAVAAARVLRTAAARVEKIAAASAAAAPAAPAFAGQEASSGSNGNGQRAAAGVANNVVPRGESLFVPSPQPAGAL